MGAVKNGITAEVALKAALLHALDGMTAAQGVLSTPSPRPIAARDIIDTIIIDISEVLEYELAN